MARVLSPVTLLAQAEAHFAYYPSVPWNKLTPEERRSWRNRAKLHLGFVRLRGLELVPKRGAKARRKGRGK